MLGVFEHYIPKFNTFNKQKQLDIILNGYDKDDEELFTTNVSLQYAVQNLIIKTKRFSSFTWIKVHVHLLSSSFITPPPLPTLAKNGKS